MQHAVQSPEVELNLSSAVRVPEVNTNGPLPSGFFGAILRDGSDDLLVDIQIPTETSPKKGHSVLRKIDAEGSANESPTTPDILIGDEHVDSPMRGLSEIDREFTMTELLVEGRVRPMLRIKLLRQMEGLHVQTSRMYFRVSRKTVVKRREVDLFDVLQAEHRRESALPSRRIHPVSPVNTHWNLITIGPRKCRHERQEPIPQTSPCLHQKNSVRRTQVLAPWKLNLDIPVRNAVRERERERERTN
jgi:hypothetical protein